MSYLRLLSMSSRLDVDFQGLAASPELLEPSAKEALDAALHVHLNTVTLACLEPAHHRCLANVVTTSATASSPSVPGLVASPAWSSWADALPAKLSSDKVSAMMQKLASDDPSRNDAKCSPTCHGE